ncbi:MAG: hypothetical protein DRO12_01340 [Thermoprotei archaeon]|nr:MAG: hypothetical protein DRO12_01340 [Thermoprotei archaeon]
MVSSRFLEEASREVRPVYAQGHFFVGLGYIAYYLVFDYHDPLGYYEAVLSNPKLFNDEVTKLSYNMQKFLDEEKVVVNNVRVRPLVSMIDIGFRGSKRRPYIVFVIRFRAPIRPGMNVYENWYSAEVPEYDYVAYWVFPPGSKVREVVVGEEHDIVGGNIVAIYGRKGVKTTGYEKIVFEIPKLDIAG